MEIKAKYFFIGAKMRGVETEWREAWGRHRGWETSFEGPGGNSANPEAWRSFITGIMAPLHPLPRTGKHVATCLCW